MKPETILRKSKTWKEYKKHLSSISDKEKGDSFEVLSKYYLQLDPKYATKLKHVWNLNNGEVPSSVHKKLNLPLSDEGIDLLAQTKEGEYWAIQCKYREDESHSLNRKELSTFTDLAFTICKGIDLALVCTTTDRFSGKLGMYKERLTFCAGDTWRGLDTRFFSDLHKHLAGKVASLTPLKPRKHQEEAIDNAVQHFKTERNARGKMIMPCGTGKSLTGYWIADKLNARKVLVAVPSLALIKQTLEVWTRESVANGTEVNWICVCSDETVKDVGGDDASVFVQDLGVHVHTDPEEIATWLKRRKKGRTVVFTTYQSGKAIAEASRLSGTTFDLGIMDEAHKTVGRKDSTFAWLLSDENIKIKKRTFMTATERRYAGSSEQLVSMDDTELYGDTFELLSFKSALEAKPPILSDYKIITIGITNEEVEDLLNKNVLVRPDKGKWDERLEAEMLAGAVALRKAIKKHPIKHAVSFHSSIARAVAFQKTQDSITDTFPEFGELSSFHVSGKVPTSVRSKIMDEFEASDRALVTNARCLTEGVDVPNIDCIIFADPKKSQVDIVQAVGRALRPYDGKKFGYILIPVLIEDGASGIDLTQKTVFDTVLTTLKALAANDERIVEYFRSISTGKQRRSGDKPGIIDIDIKQIDSESFLNSIELHLWSRLAKLSWRPFEEAREFVRRLRLTGNAEWRKYTAGQMPEIEILPSDIPIAPEAVYRNRGWAGYGDWLGTGMIASFLREYRPFNEAREFARSLNLKNHNEWRKFCKGELPEKGSLPEDIPVAMRSVYRDQGWVSMGDWLGTGTVASQLKNFRSFKEAREFARSLNLKNQIEWTKYCKGDFQEKESFPEDIPSSPYHTYKDQGWNGWGDWLGTGTVAPQLKNFRSFKEAREFARSLNLKNHNEWRKFCKGEMPEKGELPEDIPKHPVDVYKTKGWVGVVDWLGTSREKD